MKIRNVFTSIFVFASLCLCEKNSFAKKWGLGIALVDVNGFSAKKIWNGKNNADLNLGWYYHKSKINPIISAHYNWVYPRYIKLDGILLDAYIGVGFKLPGHENHVEIRTPFGVSYFFGSSKKLEAFGSIIPGMTIYPATALRLSLALGGRFYF